VPESTVAPAWCPSLPTIVEEEQKEMEVAASIDVQQPPLSPTPATPPQSDPSVTTTSIAPEKAVAPTRNQDDLEQIALARKKLPFEDESRIIDQVEPLSAAITLAPAVPAFDDGVVENTLSAPSVDVPPSIIKAFDDLVATAFASGFLDFSSRLDDDEDKSCAPLLPAEEEEIGYSDDNGDELRPTVTSTTLPPTVDDWVDDVDSDDDDDAVDITPMPASVELPHARGMPPASDDHVHDNLQTRALLQQPSAVLPANDDGVVPDVPDPTFPAVGQVPLNLPPVVQIPPTPTLRRSPRLAGQPRFCYKKFYRLRP
jgi:hypothetical protein